VLAGHLAVALALKPAEKRLNLGILFFAALFADFLLGILVLVGIEQVHTPANFGNVHYLTFTFPYSHGLVASIIWSLIAFGIVKLSWKKVGSTKAGLVVAVVVFSHFVLDWVVHIPELPILGANSPLVGLALWDSNLIMALALEVALVIAGTVIYLRYIQSLSSISRYGLIGLMTFMSLITVVGQGFSSVAPPPVAAAATWILETLLLAALAYLIDRKSTAVAG